MSIFSPYVNYALEKINTVVEPYHNIQKFYKDLPKYSRNIKKPILGKPVSHKMAANLNSPNRKYFYRRFGPYGNYKGIGRYPMKKTYYTPSSYSGSQSYSNSGGYRKKRYRKKYRKRYNGINYKSLKAREGSKLQKALNRKRLSLGLQPYTNKIKDTNQIPSSNQWTAFVAGSAWSAETSLGTISLADRDEYDSITMYPFIASIRISQATSVHKTYRILIIKTFGNDKGDYYDQSSIFADDILQDTGSSELALYSHYLEKENRQFPFKVLKDKLIHFSTSGDNNFIRTYNFKIPAMTLYYDNSDNTGDTSKNNIIFAVITDAPSASSSYTFGWKYKRVYSVNESTN